MHLNEPELKEPCRASDLSSHWTRDRPTPAPFSSPADFGWWHVTPSLCVSVTNYLTQTWGRKGWFCRCVAWVSRHDEGMAGQSRSHLTDRKRWGEERREERRNVWICWLSPLSDFTPLRPPAYGATHVKNESSQHFSENILAPRVQPEASLVF